MIRTEKRVRLCLVLLVLNLAFIWGNSMLPGELSGAFSNWVKGLLAPIFGGDSDPSGGSGLLRKLAHFMEFTCLGLCLSWLFGMLREKFWECVVFPLAAGVAVACVDELIQRFVPLRGPSIKDVGIDTLGVVLGIVFISLIQQFKRRNFWRKSNNEKSNCDAACVHHGHGAGGLQQ